MPTDQQQAYDPLATDYQSPSLSTDYWTGGGGFPHLTAGALSSGGLGAFGDYLANKSGRERSAWQSIFDPADLLQLGDAIPSPLEQALGNIGSARFDDPEIQIPFLPAALRSSNIDPYLMGGIQNLGQLLQRPGGTSPYLQANIAGRVQSEQDELAQNYEGIQAEAAGAGARGNVPVSLKGALSKALDTAQARQSRQIEQEAVAESEQLRRQDIPQVFNLLDTILKYTASGKGQAVSGLGAAGQLDLQSRGAQQQQNAAMMAGLGGLANTLSGVNWGGGGGNQPPPPGSGTFGPSGPLPSP